MDLGSFSVSLAVADLQRSRDFYAKLGFAPVPPGGEGGLWDSYGVTWLLVENGDARLGLFQGMFEQNILTWNPADVRSIQRSLQQEGVELALEADLDGDGPGHVALVDPDGNHILLDQHEA